jgi:periplasmic protein TonB
LLIGKIIGSRVNFLMLVALKQRRYSRNTVVIAVLVLLHVGGIWFLQNGLLKRSVEMLIPAEVISMAIPTMSKAEDYSPKIEHPKLTPLPVQKPTSAVPAPLVPPAAATAQPSLAAVLPAPAGITVAAAPAISAPPAPEQPVMQLPSSYADYLQNPKPSYPAMSRRQGEQGKTIVRVLIGVDGLPKQTELAKSSGFTRLDQAAMDTIMRWRFVPGKRAGVPESMWFNIPINWVLG